MGAPCLKELPPWIHLFGWKWACKRLPGQQWSGLLKSIPASAKHEGELYPGPESSVLSGISHPLCWSSLLPRAGRKVNSNRQAIDFCFSQWREGMGQTVLCELWEDGEVLSSRSAPARARKTRSTKHHVDLRPKRQFGRRSRFWNLALQSCTSPQSSFPGTLSTLLALFSRVPNSRAKIQGHSRSTSEIPCHFVVATWRRRRIPRRSTASSSRRHRQLFTWSRGRYVFPIQNTNQGGVQSAGRWASLSSSRFKVGSDHTKGPGSRVNRFCERRLIAHTDTPAGVRLGEPWDC